MIYADNTIPWLKRGFLMFALSTLVIALQFVGYMVGSSVVGVMDFGGWVFFGCSALSHAAMFALIPYALMSVLTLCRLPRVGWVAQGVCLALLVIVNYINMRVYALYRFHINGMMLNMLLGEGGGQIFTFNTWLVVKALGVFALIGGMSWGMARLAAFIYSRMGKAYVWVVSLALVGCTLFAHAYHVYASFYHKPSVVKSAALLPYYFPTTSYRQMVKWGFEPPTGQGNLDFGTSRSDINYPAAKLIKENVDSTPNIVVIMIDSWNKRAADSVTMPRLDEFARRAWVFDNHLSASNGTRSAVFGFFFGLPCYYWDAFDVSGVSPVLVDEMLSHGYDIRLYPSASLVSPPLAKVVFGAVPGARTSTPGARAIDRDRRLTADFISDLDSLGRGGAPFFAYLFYDLPHSIELSKEENVPFKPAWDYADYMSLTNDTDPTGYFNLYRNCLRREDELIGQVIDALDSRGLLSNTVVIIVGDHSQEFNENHQNYWGHNGNFSRHQIGVPMVMYVPGQTPGVYRHRTTHYDIVPTLMPMLGVTNPPEDYSAGRVITDTAPRGWHFVGSYLNYAFIVEDDVILEKKADGSLEVTDASLRPLPGYRVDPAKFKEAVDRLNHFYK